MSSSGWSILDSNLMKALRDTGLDWDIISIRFPGQTVICCREHYDHFYNQASPTSTEAGIITEDGVNDVQMANLPQKLCQGTPGHRWSPEGDARLIRLAQSNLRWEEIAIEFPECSAESCQNHYQRKLTF